MSHEIIEYHLEYPEHEPTIEYREFPCIATFFVDRGSLGTLECLAECDVSIPLIKQASSIAEDGRQSMAYGVDFNTLASQAQNSQVTVNSPTKIWYRSNKIDTFVLVTESQLFTELAAAMKVRGAFFATLMNSNFVNQLNLQVEGYTKSPEIYAPSQVTVSTEKGSVTLNGFDTGGVMFYVPPIQNESAHEHENGVFRNIANFFSGRKDTLNRKKEEKRIKEFAELFTTFVTLSRHISIENAGLTVTRFQSIADFDSETVLKYLPKIVINYCASPYDPQMIKNLVKFLPKYLSDAKNSIVV